MSHELGSEIAGLVREAAALAPPIAPPAWVAVEHPPGLLFDGPEGRAAWIQLGATIEAIDVAGTATGLSFTLDPDAGAPLRPLPVIATATTMSMTAHRLADCLHLRVGHFRDAPLRLAAHVSARLAGAAAMHDCALAWLESAGAIAELAAGLPPGTVPAGASALGAVTAARDDRRGLVRAGRAACRIWLEAVSLGLAVQMVPALDAAALRPLGLRLDGALVAALAFGPAV